MEYDNDRIIKGIYKTELYCWLLFALIHPLADSLGVFPNHKLTWIVLAVINLLLLPVYMLYSRVVVPKFLFTKKLAAFGLLTILSVLLLHALTFMFFNLFKPLVNSNPQNYFSYSSGGFARESFWIIININHNNITIIAANII